MAGLSLEEEAVYLRLFGLPSVTVTDAYQVCGDLGRDVVRAALESLTDKGLLTQSSQRPHRYTLAPPELALGAQLLQQEEEIQRVRSALTDLTRRYRAAPRQAALGELAEIVTGRRLALRRWGSALQGARHQVRVLGSASLGDDSLQASPDELELLSRDVAMRAVYDASAVSSKAMISRRRTRIAAGEQARMTDEVRVRVMLVDDRLALMPLAEQPGTDTMLIAHPSALLDALSELFELTWVLAVPLELDEGAQPLVAASPVSNKTTRIVLSLLAVGLSDHAIARRLGCSERTVQRHARRIMDATGAKTRFQAGLKIGQRWPRQVQAEVQPGNESAEQSK